MRATDDSRPHNGLCRHGDSGPGSGPRRRFRAQPCWLAAGQPTGPTERMTTWPFSLGTFKTCTSCWVGVTGKACQMRPGRLKTGTECLLPPHPGDASGVPMPSGSLSTGWSLQCRGPTGPPGPSIPLTGPRVRGPHVAHRSSPFAVSSSQIPSKGCFLYF